MKSRMLVFRITPEQEKELKARMRAAGFFRMSEYLRSILFFPNNDPTPIRTEDFAMLRGERRSFFCPNMLWEQMKQHVNGRYSISQFIKHAIIKKIEQN